MMQGYTVSVVTLMLFLCSLGCGMQGIASKCHEWLLKTATKWRVLYSLLLRTIFGLARDFC